MSTKELKLLLAMPNAAQQPNNNIVFRFDLAVPQYTTETCCATVTEMVVMAEHMKTIMPKK